MGYDNNCCCVAICLGRHSEYSNQSLWLKIDYKDISKYLGADDKSPRILKRKDGEPCFILPWSQSYDHVIDDARKDNVINNIQWLNSNADTLIEFSNKSKNHIYEKINNLDIGQNLISSTIEALNSISQNKTTIDNLDKEIQAIIKRLSFNPGLRVESEDTSYTKPDLIAIKKNNEMDFYLWTFQDLLKLNKFGCIEDKDILLVTKSKIKKEVKKEVKKISPYPFTFDN